MSPGGVVRPQRHSPYDVQRLLEHARGPLPAADERYPSPVSTAQTDGPEAATRNF